MSPAGPAEAAAAEEASPGLAAPAAAPSSSPAVTRAGLLTIYLAVPAAALLWLLDATVGQGWLREAMPASPVSWPVYGLIFGMPHICASLLGVLDAEVLRHHRRDLFISLAWTALACGLMLGLLSETWGLRLLVVWTMFHVMGQQTGLALGAARLPRLGGLPGRCWRLMLALAAAMLALAVGGESAQAELVRSPVAWTIAAGLGLLLALPLALLLYRRASQCGGDGRMLLATQALCLMSWVLLSQGLSLLALLLPRLVHDVTAFYFYVQHAGSPGAQKNWVYGPLMRAGLWHRSALIPLALALAALLAWLPTGFALSATLLHYTLERHLWRQGAPLRQRLKLV